MGALEVEVLYSTSTSRALMNIKMVFLLSISSFLILWDFSGYAAKNTEMRPQTQVQQIDQQIKELQDMKRGFEARALRHEDQADRLQFDDQTYLEMRRHNQLAAENRAKAEAVQEQINRLQLEREKLINDVR